MTRKGGFKNLKLGKNVHRQMKRRGPPDTARKERPSPQRRRDRSEKLPSY